MATRHFCDHCDTEVRGQWWTRFGMDLCRHCYDALLAGHWSPEVTMRLSPPIPQPKPSKGARLRTKQAAIRATGRARLEVYLAVNVRDRYQCRACGKRAHPGDVNELTRGHHHHVVYRSKGGEDATRNVCLLCATCHADVHEGRLTIRGNADGDLKVTRK